MKKMKNLIAMFLVVVMAAILALPAAEVEAASAPKKTKITSLKSPTAGKVTVKYKKVSGAKYQIQVATNSKMTKGKKTYKSGAVTKTISLIKGKKYYVRIRTYKKINGKTKYSKWSAKKTVTVRKTGSAHVHSYTTPVTEKRTVMVQVPFSLAKYQRGEFNRGTKDYYKVEYGELGSSSIFNTSMTEEDILDYLTRTSAKGWVEKWSTLHYYCPTCMHDYGRNVTSAQTEAHYAVSPNCGTNYTNKITCEEIVEHKATPTTQTVTVGKKCSCGKIQYY